MDFVIEHQAKFSVDLRSSEKSRLTDATLGIVNTVGQPASITNELAVRQIKTGETVMGETMKEMGDRLNSFSVVVEKHIAYGHNGKPKRRPRRPRE
jgi:hypothetical protein